VSSKTKDLFSTELSPSLTRRGRVEIFGGPNDRGTAPNEGLALIGPSEISQFQQYFLPQQPPGTTGLTRRLDPKSHYIAARWDYSVTSQSYVKTHRVIVKNQKNGKAAEAQPVDWGPNLTTGRVASISPGLAESLELTIDGEVVIEIP
jgi:hypothetical protein